MRNTEMTTVFGFAANVTAVHLAGSDLVPAPRLRDRAAFAPTPTDLDVTPPRVS